MEDSETATELLGIRISEPVTAITDLLVSAVCLYAFLKLRKSKSTLPAVRLFAYYFLTMSISTAYGGIIGHAFIHALNFGWKVPTWILSMFSIALIERAAIFHAQPLIGQRIGRFFSAINIIELITMLAVVLSTLDFFYVEAHAAYGLLVVVFSFELFIYRKKKNEESKLLLIAVGISAIAATVHLSQFTVHRWFNHNDFAHVLMAMAAYVFYLGAKQIKAIEKSPHKLH